MKSINVAATTGNMVNEVHIKLTLTSKRLKKMNPIAIEIPSITAKLAKNVFVT